MTKTERFVKKLVRDYGERAAADYIKDQSPRFLGGMFREFSARPGGVIVYDQDSGKPIYVGISDPIKKNPHVTDVVVRIRAKAFQKEGLRYHLAMVSGSDVRIWDPVAGYFTNVHSLDDKAKKRAIATARRLSES